MKIKFPNCNFFELHEPIRWSTDDPLESWLDELLLVKDISPSKMISAVKKKYLKVDNNYLSNNEVHLLIIGTEFMCFWKNNTFMRDDYIQNQGFYIHLNLI